MKHILHFLKFIYFIIFNFPKFLRSKILLCKNIKIDILKEYELIFSNSIGGGTETYLKNYLKQRKNCLLIRVHSYLFDYYYELIDVDKNIIIYISLKHIIFLFRKYSFSQIFVNTLVNYFNYSTIINLICNYHCEKKFMLHDYYCVCPVPMLFVNGKYCDGNNCLENNCFKYNAFAIPMIYDINVWRNKWKELLSNMNEIRCFSDNSYKLLSFFYKNQPWLDKVTIVPHDMGYCNITSIIPNHLNTLNVGIIGIVNTEGKGCKVVGKFLEYVRNMEDINVSIIGSLSYKKIKSKNIHYLGKYKLDNLENIIKKSGVNCFLFPSLWPETFSYCVSEIMQFNIPIVCFDLGAQADKIKNYKFGELCYSKNPEDIFLSLKKALEKYKL